MRTEKSGLSDRQSATQALARSMSPSCAWHPAMSAAMWYLSRWVWANIFTAS